MGNCNNTKQSSSSSSANRQQNKLNVQGHGEITETKVTYKILILGDAGRWNEWIILNGCVRSWC